MQSSLGLPRRTCGFALSFLKPIPHIDQLMGNKHTLKERHGSRSEMARINFARGLETDIL
jgi:hypothetical protein